MGQASIPVYRPDGCQIAFSDEGKILLNYADIKETDGSEEQTSNILARIEINAENLLAFFFQIATAGAEYQEKYSKDIGFGFLLEALGNDEQQEGS